MKDAYIISILLFLCISEEKIVSKELDADTGFIDQCQEYLETRSNTLAMYGKLGSEKRILAAQKAIRLAKKYTDLKIKIVREGDLLSVYLGSMQSTILVKHNPLKTWFTSKHPNDTMSCFIKNLYECQKE